MQNRLFPYDTIQFRLRFPVYLLSRIQVPLICEDVGEYGKKSVQRFPVFLHFLRKSVSFFPASGLIV